MSKKNQIGLKREVVLRPHQQDAVQHIIRSDGKALLAHGTGTGKTLTSIAGFEELRKLQKAKRALVVAPASLLTNFREQGVQKFTNSSVGAPGSDSDYQLVSLERFRKDPQRYIDDSKADTLIIDEVHRAKNRSSISFESLRSATRDPRIKNVIGLTGSLVSNHPKDVVPLLDITTPEHQLGSQQRFAREHVTGTKISGGFLTPPSTKYNLKNRHLLKRKAKGLFHYVGHDDLKKGLPKLRLRDVPVTMSKDQQRLYDFAMGKLSPMARAKIRAGLPPSQSEAQHIFAQITKLRQAANSVGTHRKLDPAEAAEQTPKLRKVIDDVQAHIENTKDGQAVIFSNLINGGAKELHAGLIARGIKTGLYTGPNKTLNVTKKSRDKDVRDFLSSKNRAIVITPAGNEGLSLNNATFFGAVDTHFNPEKNQQAIARARRFGGLSHRDEKDRVIDVRRYRSEPRQSVLGKAVFGKEVGVDEWIQRVADEKDRLNTQLRNVAKGSTMRKKASKDRIAYGKPKSYLSGSQSARDKLRHILITGQSGSGKSTEADRLGKETGLPVIHLDDQPGFGAPGVDPNYIEDLDAATQQIINKLDKPHIVEGTQMMGSYFPVEFLKKHDLRIMDADEDELVRRLTTRGWNTASGEEYRGAETADKVRKKIRKDKQMVERFKKRLHKTAQVATKRDPEKWARAKAQAKAKMGGKHSARAMQLATQIYKKSGGTYAGKKPSASTNKLKKWGKQKWRTRPGTSPIAKKSDGSTSRYLPEKKWRSMKKEDQIATDVKKRSARTQYIANTARARVKSKAKYY